MPTGGGGKSGGTVTPTTFYPISGNLSGAAGGLTVGGANNITAYGIYVPQLSVAALAINVTLADGVNLYDFGVYSAAGSLLVNVGAQSLPSTGVQRLTFAQGLTTITTGLVFLAWTGNSNNIQLGFVANGGPYYATGVIGTSSGGTLPASVTPLARSLTFSANLPQWLFSS